MLQLYSKHHLKSFLKSCLSPQRNHFCRPKQFYFVGCRNFSLKPSDNSEKPEQVIISEEELVNSQLLRDKSFRERNKLTLGMFGTGLVSSFIGFPLIATTLYAASFVSLFRAEKYGLKLRKLYEDMKGINTQKYENLNSLLKDLMLKNEEINKFVRKDTLCFTNMYLQRRSHAENRMFKHNSYEAVQRRYLYTLKFFDVSTGAEGKIQSQCVYNYDKDYYFRLIYIHLVNPTTKVIKIEDNRNTIDI